MICLPPLRCYYAAYLLLRCLRYFILPFSRCLRHAAVILIDICRAADMMHFSLLMLYRRHATPCHFRLCHAAAAILMLTLMFFRAPCRLY